MIDTLQMVCSEITSFPERVVRILLHNPTVFALYERIKVKPIIKNADITFYAEQTQGVQVFHAHYMVADMALFLQEHVGLLYKAVEIELSDERITLLTNKHGKIRIIRKKRCCDVVSAFSDQKTALSQKNMSPISTGTNRIKKYILPEGVPLDFLIALGIQTKEGKTIASQSDKFRQINRFLEYIDDVLPLLRERSCKKEYISIIDFACGKAYLTFAAYYFLTHIRSLSVKMTGIDLKATVIALCNDIAKQCGFDELVFVVGDIAKINTDDSAAYHRIESVDMVMSLHACDTATDAVLKQAIAWNSAVILSAPCCQHELQTQISENLSKNVLHNHPLETFLSYGIIKERFAALLTDVLRAQFLETQGYRTQILEFIDMEHTAKNLLIRAILKSSPSDTYSPDFIDLCSFLKVNPAISVSSV